MPAPGLLSGGAVVLAFLAPSLPAGVARILAFVVLAVLVAGIPLALHRQTGGVQAGPDDRQAQRTRRGILVGVTTGVVLGAASLAVVPLVDDGVSGGGSGATVVGQDGERGGDTLPDFGGYQAAWTELLDRVEVVAPGASTRLARVRLSDSQIRATYVEESGRTWSIFRNSGGDWFGPDPQGQSSLRDVFDAAVVTADLDDLARRMRTSSTALAPDLQAGDMELVKAEQSDRGRSLIVDTPGREHLVEGTGEALVTLDLTTGDDTAFAGPDHTVQATGDGSLPRTVASASDIAGNLGISRNALQAVGTDVAGVTLNSFTMDARTFDSMSMVAWAPGNRRVYLYWAPGEFVEYNAEVADHGGPAGGVPLTDLDVAALERAVDDARTRGNLVELERDRVSLEVTVYGADGPEVEVQISDDPAAQGVYDLAGDRVRDTD